MSVGVHKTPQGTIVGYDMVINRISFRSAILTRDNFRVWSVDSVSLLTAEDFRVSLRAAKAVSFSSATRNRVRNDTAQNAIEAKMILIVMPAPPHYLIGYFSP
jgi:uncharacterized protein